MAKYNYSNKNLKENMTKAIGRDLAISDKYGVAICSHIRGKSLDRSKTILEDAINMKQPIPLTRFTNGPGHKKGKIASGRYMVKGSTEILKLIKSVESNARNKGLDVKNCFIKSILAQKAATPLHYGRQRGRVMKRTHVEIVVEEKTKEVKKPQEKKGVKK